MSYSCTDFTETITDALGVTIPESAWDNPSDQADICVAEIGRLQEIEAEIKIALKRFNTEGDPLAADALALAERLAEILEDAKKAREDNEAAFADEDEDEDEGVA